MNNESIEQLAATLRSGHFDIADIEDAIGALQELKKLQEESQPKWISVKDELPIGKKSEYEYILYLCYLPQYNNVTAGYYNPETNNWGVGNKPANVSHWMSMPEPPKEVNLNA